MKTEPARIALRWISSSSVAVLMPSRLGRPLPPQQSHSPQQSSSTSSSKETKRSELRSKAGRMPYELDALLRP